MSNKINTTTGNEVKDMNITELEGKASSSTSQSDVVTLLDLIIGGLITIGLLAVGYTLVMPDAAGDAIKESVYMVIAGDFVALAIYIFLPGLANKRKKESETSTEERSAEVAKTEEVTGTEDKKALKQFVKCRKAFTNWIWFCIATLN